MAYKINQKYVTNKKARSGKKLEKVLFLVAHDTGNYGPGAENHYNYFQGITFEASAHTFIDDKQILEIIPLNEKAWHVQYQKPIDNKLFGDDANDAAIGVELCFGPNINFEEAYKKYVWYFAYLCDKFKLDPKKKIVGHYTLDPERKTDPINAFKRYGKTWGGFIADVSAIYEAEFKKQPVKKQSSVKAPAVSAKKYPGSLVNVGDFGQSVKDVQAKLGIAADGIFGSKTEAAVKAFQKKNKLTADGKVGPATWAKLFK